MEFFLSNHHHFYIWNSYNLLVSANCCNHPVLLRHDGYLNYSTALIFLQLHLSLNLDLLSQPQQYLTKFLELEFYLLLCNLILYVFILGILILNRKDNLSNHQTNIVLKGPKLLGMDLHLWSYYLWYQITHIIFSLLSSEKIIIHFVF